MYFIFMLVFCSCACVCVQRMHAWCPQRSEEVIRSPGPEVRDDCGSPTRWMIGIDPRSSVNTASTSNTEPFFWPPKSFFFHSVTCRPQNQTP